MLSIPRDSYLLTMLEDMPVRFRIVSLLEEKGVTQSELARRSGVSFQTINAMSRNRTVRVDLSTIDAICAALDCEPGDLFERESKKRRAR